MKTNSKELDIEKTRIGNYIKSKLRESGQTIKSVVRKMNEMYPDRVEYDPGTINQINAGNMPYWKVVRMATALGYEIQWVKKTDETEE